MCGPKFCSMQISRELCAFTNGQDQGTEGFLATGPTGAETASTAAALKSMEKMSKVFKETESELYMGAGTGARLTIIRGVVQMRQTAGKKCGEIFLSVPA